MSVLVGTKKGLFTVDRTGTGGNAGYDVVATDFLGAPVTAVLDDPRDEQRIPVDGRMVVSRTLAVDGDGERLAMASTTGSRFVSDDAGDTWAHVTSGLPPSVCVTWSA